MNQALGSRYVLRERLGRGGMGTVYRASRNDGGPDRAVKVLHPNLVDDPAILARFVQERSLMTELRSPHLVEVEDLVVDGDAVGIVMELVPGGNLRAYIERYAPLPPALALTIVGQILAGLVPVHGSKVVHRDLKPENVLLTGGATGAPTVKVSDFGIARLTSSPRMTHASDVIGTPHYIAPELAEHVPATPAVDVYAAGVILYELLCGSTPYAGDTLWTALRKQAEAPPAPPPHVPDAVAALLTMWLDPRPHYRPANAAEALGQSEPVRVMLLGQSGVVPGPAAAAPPPGAAPTSPSGGPRPGGVIPGGAIPGGAIPVQRSQPTGPPPGWTIPPGASWPTGTTAGGGGAPGQGQGQSGFWTRAPGSGALTGGPGPSGPGGPSTPLYDTSSTRIPTQRSAFETGISPRIPTSTVPASANRNQLWVLLAVGAVLLAVIGAGIFLVAAPGGSKDPKLAFGVERYPQTGAEVTRTWELAGQHGDSVHGTLSVLLTRGGPVDLDEVLPHSMMSATPTITPTPIADTVKPGPDPVFRYHLQGTPGQRVTVSYVAAVPAGPRTVGRLQVWAAARNAAAGAYWAEKHQLSELTTDPPTLQINLPGAPQRLALSGKQSDGSAAPTVALDSASWKSADPGVATVDPHGWVSGAGAGTTEVTATVGKTVARAKVTVTAPAIPLGPVGCKPVSGNAPSATVNGTTVTVQWDPMKLAGCTVSGYQVTASPSGQQQDLGAGATSTEFSGLAPGSYQFTVIAEFGNDGNGPASPPSDAVSVSCGSVGAPTDITARANPSSDGSVDVNWTIPTIADGCPSPDHYAVELGGNDVTTASSTDTSTTLDSVTPGSHTVNVVGVMPDGTRIPGSGTSVTVAGSTTSDSPSSGYDTPSGGPSPSDSSTGD